ncbi:MAG: type IV secretory system conjugative DNA transfer family protein [Chitinophagales bacterium]|nr:type IV secretory system conjugative DNA transfer family protein [Chitinophagales bacterium]
MGFFTSLIQEGLFHLNKGLDSVNRELIPPETDHGYHETFIEPKKLLGTGKDHQSFSPDGEQFLPTKTANILVTGISGSGKSSVFSSGSLMNLNNNYVVLDQSGELRERFSGYFLEHGFIVKTVNYSDCTVSSGYNPLARISSVTDIHKIAHQIVHQALGNESEKFWSTQAENLIVLFARALMYQPQEFFNLINVQRLVELLSASPPVVDRIILETRNEEIINRYKSLLSYDTKLRTNVIASTLSCLQPFTDPMMQKICSTDTLELERIRDSKYILFVQAGVLHASYYSAITSILIRQLMNIIMSKLYEPHERRTLFLLDEFPTLYIPDIDIIISNIRKYNNSSLAIMIQSYSQLESRYSKAIAKTIITNCMARLYFGAGLDYETASQLSQELGQYSYQEGTKQALRHLKTATEIRQCSADTGLLIYGNYQPMVVPLRPYYTQPMMMHTLRQTKKILKPELSLEPVKFIGE